MHSETFTEYQVAINLCEEKGAIHLFIVGVNGPDIILKKHERR